MEIESLQSRVSPSLTITPVPIFNHSSDVLAQSEVSSTGPSACNESNSGQRFLGLQPKGKSFLISQTATSPDSAIHSANFSPNQSPTMSRNISGLSTPSLSRNNSDGSQYGEPQLVMSEASKISPRNSPLLGRHQKNLQQRYNSNLQNGSPIMSYEYSGSSPNDYSTEPGFRDDLEEKSNLTSQPGISRQQLINNPCPVCGDKISGFHYGIFSCESCKGFFKRTVQNKKNYVCLRGCLCPISIPTRKKCPACRFEKCIKMGMKLEAIREDRTRGGRSTYQCSYTIPSCVSGASSSPVPNFLHPLAGNEYDTMEASPTVDFGDHTLSISEDESDMITIVPSNIKVPSLLQEIMDVEHLWFSSQPHEGASFDDPDEPMVQTLAEMADKRLYKLVKWCKSLPLFKNILIDDQIALLINAWCELLVFSCCYRSVNFPGEIQVSNEKTLTAEIARSLGIYKWFDKMVNFSDQMRRLKVDYYEYVSMKVIILLTSDASSLKEAEHVRDSQEKVVQALQQYTLLNSPAAPNKFAELLLRMPELHRVCQAGKELLCPRQSLENNSSGFNLLLELLRGDH